MFSGIVDSGIVEKSEKKGEGIRLNIDIGRLAESSNIGDSVSVNGVCLTVVEKTGNVASFDVMPETIERTNLGYLEIGEKVNIELSIQVNGRIGGHFIMGHIDGTGVIERVEAEGEYSKIWIRVPETMTQWMIQKGAISLDGISMTLVDVEKNLFSVAVIPKTMEITTLGTKKEGDSLNIEVDMIAKYVQKLLSGKEFTPDLQSKFLYNTLQKRQ